MLILTLALPTHSGSAITPVISNNLSTSSPADIGWRSGFYINGLNDYTNAIAIYQSKVYVGGLFTVAGNTLANRVAMWDGTNWHSLGSGMDDEVLALAVDGRGNLYAGGRFTAAGGKPANGIARWNGNEWETLGSGIPIGYVYAIAIDSVDTVYVGGMFATAGNIDAHGIARWDGSNWHPMGNGMFDNNLKTGIVTSLAIDRYGFVYAGGMFTTDYGGPANYIARWDGSQWNGLGAGISGEIYDTGVTTLATDNRGNLFVGGHFLTAGGMSISNLARWNGDNWSVVGGDGTAISYTDSVFTILADGGNLYVGGKLTSAGGIPVTGIAMWNGAEWKNLADGVSGGNVQVLAIDRDGKLFAGGGFTTAGSISANRIAEWDGVQWSGLGSDQSASSIIHTIISDRHGGIFTGGSFIAAGGINVNRVAHWDGENWAGLGEGLAGDASGQNVATMALDKNGTLFAAGKFTRSGSAVVNNIAEWTGSNWEALGDGINGSVNNIAFDSKNNLYVGGLFTRAGNVETNNVAKWTGTEWEALDTGTNSRVSSLVVDDQDRLIVSGSFDTAGDVSAHGLARWNGVNWETLTDSRYFNASVLLFHQGTLYLGIYGSVWAMVGGEFRYLGYFDLSNHNQINAVMAMAINSQGHLIVGGRFDRLGSLSFFNLARWNGTNWENFGSGTDRFVSALLIDNGDRLYAGGGFSLAGGKVSNYFAQYDQPLFEYLPMVMQ